jgi:hypothetical protein
MDSFETLQCVFSFIYLSFFEGRPRYYTNVTSIGSLAPAFARPVTPRMRCKRIPLPAFRPFSAVGSGIVRTTARAGGVSRGCEDLERLVPPPRLRPTTDLLVRAARYQPAAGRSSPPPPRRRSGSSSPRSPSCSSACPSLCNPYV